MFGQDHPFAVVWKEGTVRVKYICMDGKFSGMGNIYAVSYEKVCSESAWDNYFDFELNFKLAKQFITVFRCFTSIHFESI